MSNQALPQPSRQLLDNYLSRCQNLGLILDKYVPWGQDKRGHWDLTMRHTIRRRGQNRTVTASGGEAKGLWLSTSRRAQRDETPSLFEVERVDVDLMRAYQERWLQTIKDSGGIAFQIQTAERMAAGLGAAHVLETALTLDRNTGLPYLPGSTVKGLARAWGLIQVARQLTLKLDDEVIVRDHDPKKPTPSALDKLAQVLIGTDDEKLADELKALLNAVRRANPNDPAPELTAEAEGYITVFRSIFGSQANAGAITFTDAIYYGKDAPEYAADVMTPHYVNYYGESGRQPPTEDDNPNPVSCITVAERNTFAFGLIPRLAALRGLPDEQLGIMQGAAQDWLIKALVQLGAGSKTAAGYGFFQRKSAKDLIERG